MQVWVKIYSASKRLYHGDNPGRKLSGEAVLGDILDKITKEGAMEIFLEVRPSNHVAQSLHENRIKDFATLCKHDFGHDIMNLGEQAD